MRERLEKALNPGRVAGIILVYIGAVLLVRVYSYRLERTFIALPVYIYALYCLAIVASRVARFFKYGGRVVKQTRPYSLYKEHENSVAKVTVSFSVRRNLLYAGMKLFAGIMYKSRWFVAFGAYYRLLCVLRLSIARDIYDTPEYDIKREYRKLRSTGLLLLAVNFVLWGMIGLITARKRDVGTQGHTVYFFFAYDLYLLFRRGLNSRRYRKSRNPLFSAGKCVNFTIAMISVLSLEVAVISQMSREISRWGSGLIGAMGMIICLVNAVTSLLIIIRADIHLKAAG